MPPSFDRTLIAGCGYIGSALASALIKEGRKVWALRRSQPALDELEKLGASPICADLTNPNSLRQLPEFDAIVVCVAPARGHVEDYQATYLLGVKNLLQAVKARNLAGKLIYISSTSVYGQLDGGWVDENSPAEPSTETGKILISAEKQVFESSIPAIIFRLGGIYGPGRNRIEEIKRGGVEISNPENFVNLIHRDDVVRAVRFLMEKGKPGEVYLGVDDAPVSRRAYFTWIAKKLGVSVSAAPESVPSGKRCRNSKLKAPGFYFRYPTFREGYEDLVRDEVKA